MLFAVSCVNQAYQNMFKSPKYFDVMKRNAIGGKASAPIAYCRTMFEEFWTELSVAYLWDRDSEYNIHFPHNRAQLREYDSQSYAAIEEVWNQLKAWD